MRLTGSSTRYSRASWLTRYGVSRALSYRLAEPSDDPFLYSAFLDSYKHSHAAGPVPLSDWARVMTPIWAKFLARSETWVAHHPGDSGTIANLYGFITVERRFRHNGQPVPYVVYIYIKQKYRKRFGIFRGLFAAAGIELDQPFHYMAKTGVLSKMKGAAPLAKWSPAYMRHSPPRDPTPAERDDHGDHQEDSTPQSSTPTASAATTQNPSKAD